MAWQQISVVVDAEIAGRVGDALTARGALAVTLEDASDQPLYEPSPGTTPLWRSTSVTGLFDATADFETLAAELGDTLALPASAWRVHTLEDQAWERVWMERFKPMRFGARLWICPSHHPVPSDANVVVALDPGLAFGTGTHPTTGLCLRALDATPLLGASVLDYGCGSGILAIAALKLGANHAVAVDIDPQALTATLENARRNGVDDRLDVREPRAVVARSADVVVANILAGPLVALAPTLLDAARDDAHVLLSGILLRQADAVMSAYAGDLAFAPPALDGGWVCLHGRVRRAMP